MPYRQFRRCDAGLEPWPPGFADAFADAFEPLTFVPKRTKVRDDMQLSRDRKTIIGRPIENDHACAQWLKKQGLT
jgi:hypothetical protein